MKDGTTRHGVKGMSWVDILERLKRATGLTDRQVAAMEKRRAFRVVRRVGLLGIRPGGDKVPMMALDFAAQGLRVESPVRLRKEEIVVLYRALQPEDLHRHDIDADDDAPRARVVWVRKRKDSVSFELGMAFLIDSAAQRKAVAHFLLDDCRVGIRNPREMRRTPRVAAELRGLVMTADCNTSDVTVKDLAVGGALVVSPRQIERNSPVDLKIFLPNAPQALQAKGTVVRCLRVGARSFELGVSFTTVADDHRDRLVSCLSRLLGA
jgi:hypothetical protein